MTKVNIYGKEFECLEELREQGETEYRRAHYSPTFKFITLQPGEMAHKLFLTPEATGAERASWAYGWDCAKSEYEEKVQTAETNKGTGKHTSDIKKDPV